MYWQRFNPPTLIFIPVSIREPIFYSQYTYIYIYTRNNISNQSSVIIPSLDFFLSFLSSRSSCFSLYPCRSHLSPWRAKAGFGKSVLDREKRRVHRISMSLRGGVSNTARTKRDGCIVVREELISRKEGGG